MAATKAGRGKRVWEVELVGRLARPVVVGVGDGPPSGVLLGALLGVLRGVTISTTAPMVCSLKLFNLWLSGLSWFGAHYFAAPPLHVPAHLMC